MSTRVRRQSALTMDLYYHLQFKIDLKCKTIIYQYIEMD